MRSNLAIAILLACSTLLPACAQNGLPPVRNSAYMGTPGDNIRSDLGNNIYGQQAPKRIQASNGRGGGAMAGLPPCRNSAYMGQPGDGIRSDLGHQISGNRAVQQSAQRLGLPQCRNSAYMGQPGDGIRSDLGHQISGRAAAQRRAVMYTTHQGKSPSMVNAYGYADYTK